MSAPRLESVCVLRRLVQRIDRAHSPVTWIAGPPGAGKTTLAATFLQTRRKRGVWYRMDDGDADVASFFHYLRLALRREVPRAPELPAFAPEQAASLAGFARRYFRELWLRLGTRVLVLDNYQDVSQGASLHEVVGIAMSE